MESVPVVWALAGGACALVLLTIVATIVNRASALRKSRSAGDVWTRAHALGTAVAADGGTREDRWELAELIKKEAPAPVAAALSAAARTRIARADEDDYFGKIVAESPLADWARTQLTSTDNLHQVEALEVIETLELEDLSGEAANLARSEDEQVARAACDALVKLDPSMAVGVLIGLVDRRGSWVLDSLGRAADELATRSDRRVPIARPQWRNAPILAEQALLSGDLPDPGSASDAVGVLLGLLDDDTSQKRLAAVNALANTIHHPGAQIALAGALGADDRMTRFAAASRLVESEQGRQILRRAAESEGSDAASVAADVLWSHEAVKATAAAAGVAPIVEAVVAASSAPSEEIKSKAESDIAAPVVASAILDAIEPKPPMVERRRRPRTGNSLADKARAARARRSPERLMPSALGLDHDDDRENNDSGDALVDRASRETPVSLEVGQ